MTGAHSGNLWPIDKAWPSQERMAGLVRTADKLAQRGLDWAARDYGVLAKAFIRRGGTLLELEDHKRPCPNGCQAHYHAGQGR